MEWPRRRAGLRSSINDVRVLRHRLAGHHVLLAGVDHFKILHLPTNPLVFQRDPNDLRRGRSDISRLMIIADIDCIHPRH